MNRPELYQNLCYYDPRNPDYDPENGDKKDTCYCESCFKGNTKLAEQCIELVETIEKFLLNHDISIGGILQYPTQEEINKFKELTK